MQRQIKSFTHEHVRYFIPANTPAFHDDSQPWDRAQSLWMLNESPARPTSSEYTPTEENTVEYAVESPVTT